MVLKLSLPENKVVWALSHPVSREYIHKDNSAVGYQECNLIITEHDKQPVTVDLKDYPSWARFMIITSVHRGELLNTGDPVGSKKVTEKVTEITKTKEDIKPVKKTKTRRAKPKDE